MKNKLFTLLVIIPLFTLSGCSELIDCIGSSKPEIATNELRNGYVGFAYNESITAQVRNNSNDDSFYYYFDIEGTVPPGISYSFVGRKIYFTGAPTQTGVFTFKVNLKIEAPEDYDDDDDGIFEDDDRICFGNDTTQKTFTITVQ